MLCEYLPPTTREKTAKSLASYHPIHTLENKVFFFLQGLLALFIIRTFTCLQSHGKHSCFPCHLLEILREGSRQYWQHNCWSVRAVWQIAVVQLFWCVTDVALVSIQDDCGWPAGPAHVILCCNTFFDNLPCVIRRVARLSRHAICMLCTLIMFRPPCS